MLLRPSRFVRTLALLLLATAATASGLRAAPPSDTTHYTIDAHIQPATGQFDVAVDMRFVPRAPTDTLRFLLHDAMKIEELASPAAGAPTTRPWRIGGADTVHTKIVTVPLTRTASPSHPVSLSWTYAGHLPNDQLKIGGPVVSPHWIELPVEAMWVPIHTSFQARFTFDAVLDLPDGFEVVSTGRVRDTASGWRIESTVPGPDVPVIASDRLRAVTPETGTGAVTVYHAGAPDSVTGFVAEHASQVVDRYADRFQTGREADRLRITIPPVPRAKPSSYARTGLIALSHGIDPDTSLVGLIAHEAAHLWWTDAKNPMSRHNFLNESFAEYVSWLALREAYGEAVLQARIASARTKAKKAPSFDDWTPRLDGVLSYEKGPVLLHQLHTRVGDATFRAFLQRLQRNEVGTLDGMVATLKQVSGPETAQWFEAKL